MAIAGLKRAGDLDRLLATARDVAAKEVTQRVAALSAWPTDPRRDGLVVDWLEEMPYRTTGAFWTQLRGLTTQLADVRLEPRLAQIETLMAKTWTSQVGETARARFGPVLAEVGERLRQASRSLEALDDEALVALAAIDAALTKPHRPAVVVAASQEETLLAQILEDPADLSLRAVYGDLLTARGHARGELIALGFKKLEQPLSPQERKREKQLVKELLPELAGPLYRVLASIDVEVHTGFLSTCVVDEQKHPQAYEDSLGHAYWSTVRDLAAPVAVVQHETARRSLERYHVPRAGLDESELVKLVAAATPLPIRTLSCIAQGPPFEALLRHRALFPRLTGLELWACNYDAASLFSAPLCAGLQRLFVELPWLWPRWTDVLLRGVLPASEVLLRAKQDSEYLELCFRAAGPNEAAPKHLELRFETPSNKHSLRDRVKAAAGVLDRLDPAQIASLCIRPSRRIKQPEHGDTLRLAGKRFAAVDYAF